MPKDSICLLFGKISHKLRTQKIWRDLANLACVHFLKIIYLFFLFDKNYLLLESMDAIVSCLRIEALPNAKEGKKWRYSS